MDRQCDMKMNATVVFLDLAENSANISALLKKCFVPETEYAYYDRDTSAKLLNSGSIMSELVERNERGLLNVSGGRFIFAFYLDLSETDKAVIDRIHLLMKDFSEKLHPGNASQIGYLICYRQDWKSGSMLAGEELKDSVMKAVTNTVHAEYLLYKEPFGTYEMQENALVRYLHMLSRDTTITKADISNEKGYLCAFAFEGYDIEAAAINEKQIREYNKWLRKENAEWQKVFCSKVVGHAGKLVKGYSEIQGDFAYWQKLFPRSAGDYRRTSLIFHRLDSTLAPHIEEERKRTEAQYLEQLEQKGDWSELREWIRSHINYHEFNRLLEENACDKFMEDVRRDLDEEYRELGSQKELERAVINLYENKIKENLVAWENWRDTVEESLRKKEQEAELNGKYESLADCLAKIRENIRFSVPPGITKQGRSDWLLSKEVIPATDFPNNGMSMEDICVYPGLRLWKVQLVSVGKYKPDDKLISQILRKGSGDEGQNRE